MPVMLLAFARAHWKAVGALLLFSGLMVALMLSRAATARFRALYAQSEALRAADAQSYRAAQEEAGRIATKAKADREAAYAQAQEETAHAYQTQLAAARDLARRYAGLHPAPGADQGRASAADMSGSSTSTGGAAPASGFAVVPVRDLDTCATAVIGFAGWQRWYDSVSATAATGDAPK